MFKGQKIITEETQITRHSPLLRAAGKWFVDAGNFMMTTETKTVQTERFVKDVE